MKEKENEHVMQKTYYLLSLTLGSSLSRSRLVGNAAGAPDSFCFPFNPLTAVAAAAETGGLGFRLNDKSLHSSPTRDKAVFNPWA